MEILWSINIYYQTKLKPGLCVCTGKLPHIIVVTASPAWYHNHEHGHIRDGQESF